MSIEIRDRRFLDVVDEGLELEQLAGDFQFTEGPIWHPREKHLTFSDIPANRMFRWSEAGGVAVFREPSNMTNGNTYDQQGRMLSCEHATSRVTRTEADGSVAVLASHYQGRELNSPNDIVVRNDGTVWFTDPTYGRADRTGVVASRNSTFAASTACIPTAATWCCWPRTSTCRTASPSRRTTIPSTSPTPRAGTFAASPSKPTARSPAATSSPNRAATAPAPQTA